MTGIKIHALLKCKSRVSCRDLENKRLVRLQSCTCCWCHGFRNWYGAFKGVQMSNHSNGIVFIVVSVVKILKTVMRVETLVLLRRDPNAPRNSRLLGNSSLVSKYLGRNSRRPHCSQWLTISALWNELSRLAVHSLDDCSFLNTLMPLWGETVTL